MGHRLVLFGTRPLPMFRGEGILRGSKKVRYVRSGLNCHYFHIIGDGKNQPNSVGVYIPIIRVPY